MIETSGKLRYGAGYKYQIRADWWVKTPIVGQAARVESLDGGRPWVQLDQDGTLTLRGGYALDGPSVPLPSFCDRWVHTPAFMLGSSPHDGLYQLIRGGNLSLDARPAADQLLHDICVQFGMPRWVAWCVLKAVRIFGASAAARREPVDGWAP